MGKLTDKQRKQIIADRVDGMSYRKLAAKYGVSPTAVRKVVDAEPGLLQKCAEKKAQNTKDMLDYLDARTLKAQAVLDLAFEALLDPDKYARSGPKDIATMMGIIIDKYAQLAEINRNGTIKNELLQSLYDLEAQHAD
jgi:hypothetical protein